MEFKVGFRKRKSDSGEVMSLLTKSIFAILLLVACAATTADTAAHPADTVHVGPYATETEHQRNDRMAWWREARFGLFIHWGVYAVPAGIHEGERIENIGEWIMHYGRIPVDEYRQYSMQFNPINYDPDAWVRMAKAAGMKYIVITAKHHDGFALFDTAVSDWDVVDSTPYGRDLLKPLAEAAQKHGILSLIHI